LERIQAAVLAIDSADDERNPPETGIMERELKRVKNARLFLGNLEQYSLSAISALAERAVAALVPR
jgi:hypothetical protein